MLVSRLVTICLPPGPLPSLTTLCTVTLGGCGGPGRSLMYDKAMDFDSMCVPSRPYCLLSRPLHCSKFRTPNGSFNGLERIDLTVIILVVICYGLESTVKMGTFMLQLTRKFKILHCTQVLQSGWV